MPGWAALASLIEGEVALPGSPAYGSQRPFNARFDDVRPEAIVSCTTPADVAMTISFARRHDLELVARSGGHSFAGHSNCAGVVVDVSPMRTVTVTDGVAKVGAGARLGDVSVALDRHDVAIPAGTCPLVGVAGLTLGGGLGILGRKYGVTSDRLVEAEIVLADGRVLRCDEHHDEDLFWALRGAGAGTFGVVTSLVFRPVPVPSGVTNVHLRWPSSRAADLIDAWAGWAPDAPDELAASLKVTAEGDAKPSVDVYGAFHGNVSDAATLIEVLVDRAGADPVASSFDPLSFPEIRSSWAHLGEAEAAVADVPLPVWLAAKSEFFRRSLPPEAIAGLLQAFDDGRAPGESRELDFMPWAGAYGRVRPDATAFVHREERFILKHAVVVGPEASDDRRAGAVREVARSWGSVHPWGSGRVFQNFADPDLDPWSETYFGPNLERLLRVKARYDPDDVFRVGGSRRGW